MALEDTYIPMTKNLFFCHLAGINTLSPHVVIATPPLWRHPSECLWGRIVSNRVVLKNIYYGKNIRQVTPFAMCILCEPRYVINLKMNQLNIFKTVLLYILLHVPFERVVTLPIWMTSFFGGHNCHTVQRKDIWVAVNPAPPRSQQTVYIFLIQLLHYVCTLKWPGIIHSM